MKGSFSFVILPSLKLEASLYVRLWGKDSACTIQYRSQLDTNYL